MLNQLTAQSAVKSLGALYEYCVKEKKIWKTSEYCVKEKKNLKSNLMLIVCYYFKAFRI